MSSALGLSRQLHAKHLESCLLHSKGGMYLPASTQWLAGPQKHWTCTSFLPVWGTAPFFMLLLIKNTLARLKTKTGFCICGVTVDFPFLLCSLISHQAACGLELRSQQTFPSHPWGIWSCAWPPPPLERLSFFLFLRAVLHIRDHISNLFLLHPDFQPYLFLVLHKYLIFFYVVKSARLFSL